jgi:phosphohistidine swiveling domain-containing protein
MLWDKEFKGMDDEEFYSIFKEFYEKYQNAGGIAYICDSFMCKDEKDWLRETLKKGGVEDPGIFIDMGYESFFLRSDRALLELKEKIKGKEYDNLDDEELSLFKKHSKDFYWINNNYHNVEYLDAKYFFERMKELSPNYHDKKIPGAPEGGKFELNLINVARMFTVWKDVRKSGVYMGMHWFDVFLKELARRTGQKKDNLSYIHFYEVKDILLDKKDMKEEIKKRKEICFYAFTKQGYYLASGDDAKDLKKLMENKVEVSEELVGVSAYKGNVKGKVKVVFTTKDMKNIKEGDILVTNQTTPEFVIVMKKVAAIVTEQGGLTSHAAVISRELKIPCVIGTKNATKIFKDGDIVEVDADSGVIRKV